MNYKPTTIPKTNLNIRPAFRSPMRITITVPYGTYEHLIHQSNEEGRSLSNLSAFLLESAIGDQQHRRDHNA